MTAKYQTPEERSEIVSRANKKARKGYKVNLNRKRPITDEEREIIRDQLVALKVIGGYSNPQCAAIVGLSKGQVGEITNDDKFRALVGKVKKGLPQAALNLGQAYLVEGVQALVHIMRTSRDEKAVLAAVENLFDRFGLPKTTKSESKTEKIEESGSLVDQSVLEKARSASPEKQEELAALQEMFMQGASRILNGEAPDGE